MTEPKTTPRPAPTKRVNASTDGHLSGEELRARTAEERSRRHVEASRRVAAEWVKLRDETAVFVEVLLPVELRRALDALAVEVREAGDE